jgi:hypothetical protein
LSATITFLLIEYIKGAWLKNGKLWFN